MTDDQLDSALQAEYFQLQKTIEDFDGRALTIKAWSVTFSLAALGGAFVSHAKVVLLIASGSAILFWLLEATWKRFQYAYYARSGSIEEHFHGGRRLDAPFQIGNSWSTAWRSGGIRRLMTISMWPQVAMPHVVVALLGVLLFLLERYGILTV